MLIYDSRNYQVLIDLKIGVYYIVLIYDSRNYQVLIDEIEDVFRAQIYLR